jgi:putative chitobiose transport system substrate-binding protein
MNRRTPFLCLVIAAALLCLTLSCTGNKQARDSRVHLEFWTISLKPTYDQLMGEVIAEYEASHPDVKIDWIDMPINAVMQKLMASIAGDAAPDVVNLNSGYAQVMAQNHALACVDDLVPREKRELYFEGLWNAAGFEGRNYAIPWYVTTKVLMLNRQIFKEAGLDPGNPPKDWDGVARCAGIIRDKTGKYGYMPAIKLLEDFQVWGVPVVSADGKKALFNSPGGVAMLTWIVEMKKAGIMPPETLAEGYQGALDRYQGGKLGMIVAGPTLLLKIKKDAPGVYEQTEIAPMPTGAIREVPAATMNLVVPRSSRHREMAVDFALFVTNDKNQLKFCKMVPMVPSTRAAAADSYFKQGRGEPVQDKAIAISIEQLHRARDMSLGLPHSNDLNRVMKEALEAAFYGRKSPKEALDEAARKWDEILQR